MKMRRAEEGGGREGLKSVESINTHIRTNVQKTKYIENIPTSVLIHRRPVDDKTGGKIMRGDKDAKSESSWPT